MNRAYVIIIDEGSPGELLREETTARIAWLRDPSWVPFAVAIAAMIAVVAVVVILDRDHPTAPPEPVVIDSLDSYERLLDAGFTDEQAKVIARLFAEGDAVTRPTADRKKLDVALDILFVVPLGMAVFALFMARSAPP